MVDNTISTREWLSYGILFYGAPCGLSHLDGNNWLGHLYWTVATIYTRDANYMISNYIGLREFASYGYLTDGAAHCGVSCLFGFYWIGDTIWSFATIILSKYKLQDSTIL